jgi:hypothetical protein
MFALRRLPALVALLMQGALSLRLGLALLVAIPLTLVLLVLLFIPRAILQTILSALLWGGSLAWVGVAWMRVSECLTLALPWMRLAMILGAVTLYTAWAAWLLRNGKHGRSTADVTDGRR